MLRSAPNRIWMTLEDMASDADLVSAVQRGDTRAFGELVDRYQSLIASVAFGLTGSLSHSEEIAQDTFVIAWRRIADLRHPDRLRGWLCKIAQRRTRRFRRELSSQLPDPLIPINYGM